MIVARSAAEFGAGPFALTVDDELSDLAEGARLVVVFADAEMLFTVIGRARGALHLGSYLTPWEFIHWRCERRAGRWALVTSDRAEIDRLRRFYRLAA